MVEAAVKVGSSLYRRVHHLRAYQRPPVYSTGGGSKVTPRGAHLNAEESPYVSGSLAALAAVGVVKSPAYPLSGLLVMAPLADKTAGTELQTRRPLPTSQHPRRGGTVPLCDYSVPSMGT